MAQITISNLQKRYENVEVLRHINLTIKDGEFVVLVGPSGCGKSTLLRTIAGLELATAGDIHIGNRLMNQVAPKDRDISMVFQSYALYPHMTVARNMGFSLEVQKRPKAEIDAAVNKAADILGLTALLQRRPKELSGGQRQRVAMGRAIVREPQVFLFDEPLSNLDAQLRGQMRIEIKSLHQRMGNTIVYVTHDQVEAMTLADRIVVLNHGVIQQVGTPLELYDTPANKFVASFIGAPAMNFINGTLELGDGRPVVRIDPQHSLPVDPAISGLQSGRPVIYGVRPEAIELTTQDAPDAVPLDVTLIEPTGLSELIHGTFGDERLSIYSMVRSGAKPGDRVWISIDTARMQLFDVNSQVRLAKAGE
ncbi:sn-glycerol-3-phosphate ABC transporter ATP-binding protein UgpC [Brenneria izadpanahii]|uniref:Sn-glycerol-3-phosphate ABC transporter ATP-binding protein UgpC n=1 Tax=Brenneria izadpanahii TaxID=2722756 RepID=A0ABX7UU22_9GAMM|nr:sn-glycerol-3-phosphate ABC transporter ATP-binding protein UgpC [Brenneria izadpanahii]QTF09283.1 sn-glycerol-3-phosphate ABC transporter ATP-binding protein UgpC [Brenneria izadpanahii]